MQTSYLFISSYKQRITALDRILSSPQQQNGNHGPVEYRKLVQRFRQFLAEEDKFWTKLVLRFRRSFALDEAQPALVKLGLVLDGDSPAEGRNHNQFPSETVSVVPLPEQREGRLNILSKALVCLGDIARYREVYNDGGGRSRIGHDDAPRRGRGRRGAPPGGLDLVRPRNYTKARSCYEQAKLLVATDGNPSHQLAILASYEKDQFMSLVHYYFALCVKQPYETAADNMGTIMHKALEQWKARSKEDNLASEPPIAKIRIDIFKDKMVVLHGLWRLGLQKMDSLTKRESSAIYQEFKALLSERHLPEEFIPQILVTSQGALYTHRMLSAPVNKKSKDTSPTLDPSIVETRILNHLLLLHRALLEVGLQEIGSVDTVDMDLAQRITAPFRRTLGALRMSMKWLRANIKYLIEHTSEETTAFWRVLTDFIEILGSAFPADQLPELTSALEEDREMEGFLPLRGLFARRQGTVSAVGEHPNVVHLMRIGDILKDAQLVAEFENSPFKLSLPLADASGVFPHCNQVRDDETMTETTDDVVAEAFGHLNEEDFDDDEEEQVLYPSGLPSFPSPRQG
ncbi:hypothetical protein BDZ89DRAFT_210483 [Hymenopellis radicata]|nr:hypothetical protein BDZ89DRAFT_210483 [Hymenopellis radicata]